MAGNLVAIMAQCALARFQKEKNEKTVDNAQYVV